MVIALAALLAATVTAPHAAPPIAGPSIRETITMTDISSPAISPDGRFVAFRMSRARIEQNDYDFGWYVVPIDGSAPPRRIGGAGEGEWQDGTLLSEPPVWSPDSSAILYRATIDGEVQLWRAAIDGSATERITSAAGNVLDLALTPDGRSLVYGVGASRDAIARAEQEQYDQGVRIDAEVDPNRQLFRGSWIDGRWASERLRGFWFAHAGLLADTPPVYHTINLATLDVADATPVEAELISPPVKPRDMVEGHLIDARAESGDARGTGYVLAAHSYGTIVVTQGADLKQIARCTLAACVDRHIRQLAWQPGADRLIFTTTDGHGNDAVYGWNVAADTVDPIAAGTGTLNGGRDQLHGCAVGRDQLVCVAAAANQPPRLVAIDLATGKRVVLADPDVALKAEARLHFTQIRWTDRAGRHFSGQLMLPAGARGPVPLFMTYYICSGYLRGGTGDEYPLRALAQHGIAALCIDRYPATEGISGQADNYKVALSGVTAVVDRLVAQGVVDRRHIGMGGVSFGGEVAIWVAMHTHLLSAVSVSNVMLTPTYYWFNAVKERQIPTILKQGWGVGDPDTDRRGWRRLSPAFNVDRIHAALLMQLPEREYRPNVELLARLQRTNTPVELWAFPNETHIKYQPRHRLAANVRNLDWFCYWLTGWADPDPEKRDQYAHWRAFARQPPTSGGETAGPRAEGGVKATPDDPR